MIIQLEGQKGRLDKVLTEILEGWSRSKLQRAIKNQTVLVNGQVEKANYQVQGDEQIELLESQPRQKPLNAVPEAMDLEIVYEDSDLLIVNKPQGMVMHPSKGHQSGTLVNGLVAYLGQDLSHNQSIRPGIVHRLDKDTAGLVVIAKNDLTHTALAQQIQDNSFHRFYLAYVHGEVSPAQGKIEMPLRRSTSNRMRYEPHIAGKYALTEFQTLDHHHQWSQVALELKTGRTHQLRVHLEAIGHPIIGDPVYRRGIDQFDPKLASIKTGQWLFASGLSFIHPRQEERMTFDLDIPSFSYLLSHQ